MRKYSWALAGRYLGFQEGECWILREMKTAGVESELEKTGRGNNQWKTQWDMSNKLLMVLKSEREPS